MSLYFIYLQAKMRFLKGWETWVMIDITDGVKIDGTSNVVLADVQGSNGVVHVIDKVILP